MSTVIGFILLIGVLILVAKDSSSHRILMLILSDDKKREYNRLKYIPGYAIYYLRKWAKEVKAREDEEMSRDGQIEKGANK